MLSLLRQPRWLGYLALATVFATLCSAFGVWQWNRREEAIAAIERLENNFDRPPIPLTEALDSPAAYSEPQQWTPVEVEGEYLADETLLLRGRVRGGSIGFDVIVPFRTVQGEIFVIDRGWIAQGPGAERPATEPQTPGGTVRITARLRANEGDIAGRGAPEGQIASVNLETIAARLGETTYTGAYGLLIDENGTAPGDVAVAVRPQLDEGPHLSYTLQWFVFAAGGFAGLIWAMRQELRGEPAPPVRRRCSDAEIEDEALDADAGRLR